MGAKDGNGQRANQNVQRAKLEHPSKNKWLKCLLIMEKLTRLQILASHLKGAALYVYHDTPFMLRRHLILHVTRRES